MARGARVIAIAAVLAIAALPAFAQRGRRGARGETTVTAPPLEGVSVSIQGTLEQLTKKEIMVQEKEGRLVTIRRSKKTKFYENGEEIKGNEIDMNTPITVDASEDRDLKLLALRVTVNGAAPKTTLAPR